MKDEVERVVEAARKARERGVHLVFSFEARFNDPLVSAGLRRLRGFEFDEGSVAVAARVAEQCAGPALYFPAPLARALAQGVSWEQAADRFHYDMIRVDEEQRWTWRGQPVAERTKDFFLEHLYYEAEVGRWAFEYKVNDGWWDKSYLDAVVSPLRARRLEVVREGEDAEVIAVLVSGQNPRVLLDSLRLDDRERLFVGTEEYGEVLVADTERFRILRQVDDDLQSVNFAGSRRPLRWPAEPSVSR